MVQVRWVTFAKACEHLNPETTKECPSSAFPILPIFCLILSGCQILCTWGGLQQYAGVGGIENKMAKQTERAKDLNAAAIEMRKELARKIAAHARSPGETPTCHPGSGALPSNGTDGMLPGHLRAQLYGFRAGTKAHQSRRDHLLLRRIVVSPVVDRCSG